MGEDDARLARLLDTDAYSVGHLTDENYAKIKEHKTGPLIIEQPGSWPEFLFKDTVIKFDIEGSDAGWWYIDEVTHRGMVLHSVPEPQR